MLRMAQIPDSHADLLTKPALAWLSTLMPDGSPQVTPVWILRDGDDLIINSARGRVKDKNLRRDGRVAVAIGDPANPYRYVSVRGRIVEVTEKGADDTIDALSLKYTGQPKYQWRNASEVRVNYRIRPEKVATNG